MAKVLVSIPDDFLNSVDRYASSNMQTRSRLIREALSTYMRKAAFKNSKKREDNAKILEELLN